MSDLAIPDHGEYQQNREKSAGRCPEGLQLELVKSVALTSQSSLSPASPTHLPREGLSTLGCVWGVITAVIVFCRRSHSLTLPSSPADTNWLLLQSQHSIYEFLIHLQYPFLRWLGYFILCLLGPIDRTDQTYVRWKGVSTIKNNLQKQEFTFRCYSWLQITYLSSLYFFRYN